MDETVNRYLSRLYYELGSPYAYSSLNTLHSAVKKYGISKNQVHEWLIHQDSYTLHRKANRNGGRRRKVFVRHIDDQWSADLCDMSNVSDVNDGVKYMLTVVDVFSKFAWVEPVKNKSGTAVTNAFKAILRRTQRRPRLVESDNGKEFFNAPFKALLQTIPATLFSTTSANKASVVERFNRTIKQLIYKYFTHKRTYRWLDSIQQLVETYNSRQHRSIGIPPKKVVKSNEKMVFSKLYGKQVKTRSRLYLGDLVRISKIKAVFEKGYLPNYTEEVFRVKKVRYNTKPTSYVIEDLMGEEINGTFDATEIKRVGKSDDIWRVEKIIKRDVTGRAYVKWYGFPQKFNSWVSCVE